MFTLEMALLSVGLGAVLFAPNKRFMTLLAFRGSKTTKGMGYVAQQQGSGIRGASAVIAAKMLQRFSGLSR